MASERSTNAVAIFGSGRSGTTWVQDALAKANNYSTVFEPLHPAEVEGAERYANRYIRPGTEDPELRDLMQRILTGRVAPVWTRMRVRRRRLLPTTDEFTFIRSLRNLRVTYLRLFDAWRKDRRVRHRPPIVKFIRGNLLAEWLAAEFKLPAAVIVRHPCAVLASVIRRTGNEWSIDAMRSTLDRYLEQEVLISDRLAGVVGSLSGLTSFAGVHTAIWCIENGEFVTRGTTTGLHVCFYEDLVRNRDDAWRRLTASLGLGHVPDQQMLLKPSQQAGYPLLRDFSTERLLSGWLEKLDARQTDEVAAVLDVFGITAYSCDDPMPVSATASMSGRPASSGS